MEGAYVDSSFSLVLIVTDCVNENGEAVEWTVHRDMNQTSKMYRSVNSKWVTTSESRGCYDGCGSNCMGGFARQVEPHQNYNHL
jgi:hypothetical protein